MIAEQPLWSSVRALQEREMLLRRLSSVAQATGDTVQAEAGLRQARPGARPGRAAGPSRDG